MTEWQRKRRGAIFSDEMNVRQYSGSMKTPGGWKNPEPPGALKSGGLERLEHAEYDGADKGECDIRGDNAQSADERTDEVIGNAPWFTSLPALTLKASKPFPAEKVSVAVARGTSPRRGNVVKES